MKYYVKKIKNKEFHYLGVNLEWTTNVTDAKKFVSWKSAYNASVMKGGAPSKI